MRLRGLVLFLAVLAGPAAAQTVVTSPAPDNVAVTVYRDPNRPADQRLDLRWLNGFALVSETRRVTLPAGEAELRFEGVAGGILPQSAIVSGLLDGIVERNRDAYLLSPGTLLDRSLGRRVHLRRTSLATGEVREHEAVIRSGLDGGVVLQTSEGFEALRCSGLAETIVYDDVPAGLSARPTLSVRTRSQAPVSATVTLSYLASGFDWQANYVATLSPDGNEVDLFAWLTLANGDETGFRDASTQAVAGRLNRENVAVPPSDASPLRLDCWPQGTTSDLGEAIEALRQMAGPPPPPPPPAPVSAVAAESIVVTGSRVMAEREDLGDLKLYRIPEPVTVAANSQKQVALLHQPDVDIGIVHRSRIDVTNVDVSDTSWRFLVTRNRESEGLGLPLPAGGLVLFSEERGRPILIGEGSVDDSAVGEDVEIRIGEAPDVQTRIELVAEGKGGTDQYALTVTNATPRPIRFEGEFLVPDLERFVPVRRLPTRDGRPLWSVTVPANSQSTLRYTVHDTED